MSGFQTDLREFADYPRRCASFWEHRERDTDNAYEGEDGEGQTAFYCDFYQHHRAIEDECLGDPCPCCRLIGMDDYLKHLKSEEGQ